MGDVLHIKKGNFEFASTDVVPCYQIAAVVDGLLCGLVGKIVARKEENRGGYRVRHGCHSRLPQ